VPEFDNALRFQMDNDKRLAASGLHFEGMKKDSIHIHRERIEYSGDKRSSVSHCSDPRSSRA
jgi:hypothetical protein